MAASDSTRSTVTLTALMSVNGLPLIGPPVGKMAASATISGGRVRGGDVDAPLADGGANEAGAVAVEALDADDGATGAYAAAGSTNVEGVALLLGTETAGDVETVYIPPGGKVSSSA